MLFFLLEDAEAKDETDREFMKALYIRHRFTMFRLAYSMTGSRQDAEDVVSEVCVSLIKIISRLREMDCNALEGYVISTVKNEVYQLHRRKKRRKEVSDEELLPFLADENSAPDRQLLKECTIQELMDALRKLSEGDQTVLRMKYFEERSDREIAEVLQIKEVSVRSRLTRARQRMLKLLGGTLNEH